MWATGFCPTRCHAGAHAAGIARLRRCPLVVEGAHKKGGGSTKNGRDSNSQRRGVKVYGGQPVRAGGIIVRQVGSEWYPGENVGQGKDYTLFSLIDGLVAYKKNGPRKKISVYAPEHERSIAMVQATRTTAPKEGVPSRKERRRAQYTTRSARGGATRKESATNNGDAAPATPALAAAAS